MLHTFLKEKKYQELTILSYYKVYPGKEIPTYLNLIILWPTQVIPNTMVELFLINIYINGKE